jgi:glycine/D-amino acid oxidase-like deaminating enzyme
MRLAVVGTGVVGASVGWHLARGGVDVLLVDAGEPGAGVSNWTFSWVNASNKTQTRAYFDLNVAGLAAHRQLAESFDGSDWWHPTGHLRWTDEAADASALRATVERLRSWDYDVTWVTTAQVRDQLEPQVVFPADDTEVAYFGHEGWLDGHRLVDRLVADAITHGADTSFGSAVTDITVSQREVTGVVLADGQRHVVDAVVNAAGPQASDIAALVGRRLPMREEPGLVARLHCDPVPVRRAMHTPHVEIRPDGEDGVVLHSRRIDARVEEPDYDIGELTGALHDLAVAVVPSLMEATVTGARVIQRPIPGDGFPSVGAVEAVAGYYEAVTHSGITLAAIVGRLLAAEIIEATVDPLLALYRPGRFSASG